ncbi:leucine-rich repeat protein [Streptococcus merionis]|uniref:leucine-rich repeat protein n=1 Tax=Streptococcus merionis TaxID=400065 RepID=UPI00351183D0
MKNILKLRKRRTGQWVTVTGTVLVGVGLLAGPTVLADEQVSGGTNPTTTIAETSDGLPTAESVSTEVAVDNAAMESPQEESIEKSSSVALTERSVSEKTETTDVEERKQSEPGKVAPLGKVERTSSDGVSASLIAGNSTEVGESGQGDTSRFEEGNSYHQESGSSNTEFDMSTHGSDLARDPSLTGEKLTASLRTVRSVNNSDDEDAPIDEETRKRLEYFNELRKSGLSRIEIPQGMTYIDHNAFDGAKGIKEVILPDSLKHIGNRAFAGTSIEKIILPNSLETIGSEAFAGIDTLTEVVIPKSVTSASDAFSKSMNLKKVVFEEGTTAIPANILSHTAVEEITIPSSVTSIGYGAFSENKSLTHITIPSGVKEIQGAVFSGNSKLASITLPEGLTTIADSAFSGTSSLEQIDLPSSIEFIGNYAFLSSGLKSINLENIKQIGDSAFSNTHLSEVTIPSSLEYMGAGAFSSIDNLQTVYWNGDFEVGWGAYWRTPAFEGSPLTKVVFGNDVTRIPSYTFRHQSGITKIDLPEGLKTIGIEAFSYSGLTDLHLPSTVKTLKDGAFGHISSLVSTNIPSGLEVGSGAFVDSTNLTKVGFDLGSKVIVDGLLRRTGITDFVVPEGIEEIGKEAFSENKQLTRVTLPSTIKNIKEGAFANSSIKEIVFPSTMTTIPDGILQNTEIEHIVIPEGVVEIGDSAFASNPNLISVSLPSTLKKIGNHAFYGAALMEITLPSNLEEIGDSAFSSNQLKSLVIPDSVTKIGESAFNSNKIESVTLPKNLTILGDGAFSFNHLSEVKIPEKLEVLGTAFTYNPDLKEIIFSEGLKEVTGRSSYHPYPYLGAFAGTAITEVHLPSSLEKISNGAFYNLSSLSKITLPTNLQLIGDYAFGSTSLSEIDLPDSLKEIGDSAFANTSLVSVRLPSQLEVVGSGAFGTDSLTSVYIPKSLKSVGTSYGYTTSIYHRSWGYLSQSYGAFSGANNLKEVTFEAGITEIVDNLFGGSGLKTINLPDTLIKIGENAFAHSKLEEINLPTTVEAIGGNAFANTNLSEVIIPNSVKTLGYGAFDGASHLAKATLSEGLDEISDKLFYGTALSSIVLPNSIKRIGGIAFADTNLRSVNFSDNLEMIGANAFSGTKLTSIKLPSTLKTLETGAFAYIDTLTDVYIPKQLDVGSYPFQGDKKLTKVELEKGRTKIPDTLLYDTGIVEFTVDKGIQEIGYQAFANNKQLKKVTLPDGLTRIWDRAFSETGLERIVIPDSVDYLGYSVFSENKSLKEAELSKNLTNIPSYTFQNTGLISITIPASVESINESAFSGANLSEISFSDGLKTIGHAAFAKNNLEFIKLPKTLENLYSGAFADNYRLKTVYISSDLNSSHQYYYSNDYASPFKNWDSSTQASNIFVTFKEGVTRIPAYLFNDTKTVYAVVIPEGVTEIGEYAFNNTGISGPALDDPLLPSTLKKLGSFAFGNNEKLTRINLPKGLEIADQAFDGSYKINVMRANDDSKMPDGMLSNTGVTTFVIPEGVTEVGKYALKDNYKMVSESWGGTNKIDRDGLSNVILPTTLTKIDTRAFEKTSLTFVDIPDSVSDIGMGAFRFNSELASVKLPAELRELRGNLFEGNGKITQLILPDKVTSIDSNAFINMENLAKVYIPSSVTHIGDNLHHNPNTVFLVKAGSYAQAYMEANGIAYQITTDDFANYNKSIVIKDKTSLRVASQSLKQSGHLALSLNYAFDTEGRDIQNKEIRITLPEGVEFDKTVSLNGWKLEAEKLGAEKTQNVLYLKNLGDSGRIDFTVKTVKEALTRLDVTAQVVYNEYGVKKSEKLGTIQEDMPFLKVNVNEYFSSENVRISGVTLPKSKVQVRTHGLTNILSETQSRADGTFDVTLKLDVKNAIQDQPFYLTFQSQQDDETIASVDKTILYRNSAPSIKSFIVSHNNRTINLTDGQPNENLIFRPGEKFKFEVELDNHEGINVIWVKSNRNGVTKDIKLGKDEKTKKFINTSQDYFGDDINFIPKDFYIVADKTINRDTDGDGLIDSDKVKISDNWVKNEHNPSIEDRDNNVWNVSDRDLAIFAALAYEDYSSIGPLFSKYDGNGNPITALTSESKDKINSFGQLKGLDIGRTDEKLFTNWRIFDYHGQTTSWFTSNHHVVFVDKSNKNVVIAYRGTNESVELPQDLGIPVGIIEHKRRVEEQIPIILKMLKSRGIYYENIYVTGHSLGGYLAYHAAAKIAVKQDEKDKLKKVVNFNGPGLSLFEPITTQILESFNNNRNKSTIILYSTFGANNIVTVQGKHPGNIVNFFEKVPLRLDKKPFTSHNMQSIMNYLDQGYRTSKPAFIDGYPTLDDVIDIKQYTLHIPETLQAVIDPSGTVYNSVTSKPVSGVQATVYFKDDNGEEKLWYAADYSQLNPVLTNVNGEYAWDVPEGLWKVKVAKDGYEVAESDWLPVPPPQTGIDFKLVPKTYQLTFHLNGGSFSENMPNTYQTDVEASLAVPSRPDYHFDGWYESPDFSGDKVENTLFSKIGDKELWAKWVLKKETKLRQETRILTTDRVEYLPDDTLFVDESREEASVNGQVVVEITEVYADGVLESSTEKELSRVEAIAKKIYQGTKSRPVTKTRQEIRILTTNAINYLDDETLDIGQTREVAAVDGQVVVEITEVYQDGKLVSSTEKVLSRIEAQPKKVYRGTKAVLVKPISHSTVAPVVRQMSESKAIEVDETLRDEPTEKTDLALSSSQVQARLPKTASDSTYALEAVGLLTTLATAYGIRVRKKTEE